jgi:NAD(P)-dependent dehydrogenase (short-subunit alcohol dehydrogenase family)
VTAVWARRRQPTGSRVTSSKHQEASGRTVLITGASSGIGLATAREFRDRGWKVYGTARTSDAIPGNDRVDGVTYLPLDLCKRSSIDAFAEAVPRIDVLINNAGIGQAGAFEDQPVLAEENLFQVNVFGPLAITRACLPAMRAQQHGTIVFVGSLIADFPVPFQSGYAATKLALWGYVQSLRHELGPRGIRTILVQPGYIRTGIAAKRPWVAPADSPYFADSSAVRARVERAHRRASDPIKVARHLVKLCEQDGPLPPRTTIGRQAKLLGMSRHMMSDAMLERLMARRFGLALSASRYSSGISRSISASQACADMSDGARQSPRGDNEPPCDTLGPLGSAERLNWLNE